MIMYNNCLNRHGILLLLTLLLFTPVLYAESSGKPLLIKNNSFVSEEGGRNPISDWTFEAIKTVVLNKETASVKLIVEPEGDAKVRVPKDGQGVLFQSTQETARGDLISAPFNIRPYCWVEVTVEYRFESGKPFPFICLRPTGNRAHVDLEFLPQVRKGERTTAKVRLHSGFSDKSYSLSVSITGMGSFRVFSIDAKEGGDYPRPDKPLFVLDTLHAQPPKNGKLGWKDATRLLDVFGFPSLEFLHYSEITPEKLKAIDPGLIIISPKSEELPRSDYGLIKQAVRTVLDHGAPVVGICQGHQLIPFLYGTPPYRKAEIMDDGTRRVLSEWGDTMIKINIMDPIFEGLPRFPYFCASLSHFAMVPEEFKEADILASTELCETQILKYPNKPWYTFQAHIERDWEHGCPEAYLIWKNMLRYFFLAP